MFLISYYLEKGYKLKELLNLDNFEKAIMIQSALFWIEQRNEEKKALFGGNNE